MITSTIVLRAALVIACIGAMLSTAPALGAAISECSAVQEQAPAHPDWAEVRAHRRFALPVLTYAHDGRPAGRWGMFVRMRIDSTGRVACVSREQDKLVEFAANDQRLAVLAQLSDWRYVPFLADGKPADAFVYESIAEQHLPERHVPLPDAPLELISIQLKRTQCFGTCPVYEVTIRGNGKVVYYGDQNVDAGGRHAYSIPLADVARLVAKLRDEDIWSMDASYVSEITDFPDSILTIRIAGQLHRVFDHVGRRTGMPKAVSDFEDEVDDVARTNLWIEPGHKAESKALKSARTP